MLPLVIYGAGGHGRETALLLEAIIAEGAQWQVIGFLDDDGNRHGDYCGDLPILGDARYLAAHRGRIAVALGVGSPHAKQALVTSIRHHVAAFPRLIHPSVNVHRRVTLGEGAQLHAGTIVTVDCAVGAFVTCNRHVDISHDCVIDAFATLAPAVTLTGAVHVGEGADLGARVTCIPGVHVGSWSVVGAGAVVTRDLPEGVTAVGVPARILRRGNVQSDSTDAPTLALAS